MGWSLKTWAFTIVAAIELGITLATIPNNVYLGVIIFAVLIYYANASYKEDNKPKED